LTTSTRSRSFTRTWICAPQVGDCDIRLPADVIAGFSARSTGASAAPAQAARLFKSVLFDEVTAYASGSARILQ
jgi:hypothetical protein